MSTMNRAGRNELLQTVQAQEEKLKRYESRLHDLVIAYRTNLKEKATLEETVKALSEGGAKSAAASSSPDEQAESQRRVDALTQSLASLTEDKQRMEANYQSDRRRLMQEHETMVTQLRQELDSTEIVRRELQREIGELRQRVHEQRLQAERADADQACMLRELQSLLAKERGIREQLEFEVDELRERLEKAIATPPPPPPPPSLMSVNRAEMEENQRRIRDLRNEVEQLRGRQNATEVPIEQLRAELAAANAEHRVQLQRELQRANEAERRLADFTQQHEERVSTLEARLTELSQTLGSYERTREADQAAIVKLRERVTQLDLENSALVKGVMSQSRREKSPESGCSEDSLEAETEEETPEQFPSSPRAQEVDEEVMSLVETISQLKGKLKLANSRAARPVDLACVFTLDSSLQEAVRSADDDLHRRCREECEQLKEEFERYKLKAQSVLLKQSVLSSRSAGGGAVSMLTKEQADRLQNQVGRLKERCRELQDELMNEDRLNKRSQAALRRALEDAEERHRTEMESAQREADQRVAKLDEELTRHRNRTIALLAEKDEEISVMRAGGSAVGGPLSTTASVSALLREDSVGKAAVLPGGSMGGVSPVLASCSIIHCQQERARLAVENRSLREANRSLEASEREADLLRKDLEERLGCLERAERLRAASGPTGASGGEGGGASNLEYLKNVVLSYMTTTEGDSRRSMLRAIGTILQFSPREMRKVENFNAPGWFTSGR